MPVEVHTSPLRTMKKCVELQVATKPCGSSISASSAPALVAWMQAVMQLSLLWLLSLGSCTSGAPRRTCTVNSANAALERFRFGILVFGNDDDRRRTDRHARILIWRALDAARDHQADMRVFAHAVRGERAIQRARQFVARQADVQCRSPWRLRTAGRGADRETRCGRHARAALPRRRRRARSRNRTPTRRLRRAASTRR